MSRNIKGVESEYLNTVQMVNKGFHSGRDGHCIEAMIDRKTQTVWLKLMFSDDGFETWFKEDELF